ncbi:MAG: hypothetical protein RSB99_02195 [Bacilli bacterium]
MNSNLSGINEGGLDKLALDIYDTAERIHNILNTLDDLVTGTTSYYNCESGNQLRSKFQDLKAGFTVINQNIQNYGNDLVKAKYLYKNLSDDIATITIKGIDKIMDSTKKDTK